MSVDDRKRNPLMQTAVLIVAAGRGSRAGGGVPKQWRNLNGQSVLAHALAAFRGVKGLGPVALVVHPDDRDRLAGMALEKVIVVSGGATRSESVRAGLEALAGAAPDAVLIHDAARPLVSAAVIGRVLAALQGARAAAPAVEVVDALWRGQDGLVSGTQDRTRLWRAQTPQGFHFNDILAAHRAHQGDAVDDVAVARAAGIAVVIVAGDEDNLKITREGDFARAAQLMRMRTMVDVRTGNGFDVHAFGPGDHVWLCGVRIVHSHGLVGHSDADVGMHAVTDAIYGALAEGDIGQHFPPSDPHWRGAESRIFLDHACGLAARMGFTISHADCTLICEYPKIGPHAGAMRAALARIMGIGADRVSVKATTSEKLGFTGRSEGIAALATATLVKA
jgi:2-C-methyl-D-erythritol 4-phosphate cytidylyltransferase / 2-C-methyl-D-erythritol 2,4-cyclodiphosphate synthase